MCTVLTQHLMVEHQLVFIYSSKIEKYTSYQLLLNDSKSDECGIIGALDISAFSVKLPKLIF